MVQVRFIRSHSPYNAGELAGFPDAQARRLMDLGAAELVAPVVAAAVVERPPLDKSLHAPPHPNRRARQ